MSELSSILGIIDTLDVPSLAALVFYLAWRHDRKLETSLLKQQDAFVTALQAIERRLEANTAELATTRRDVDSIAADFKAHVKQDRDDNNRIFDLIEKRTSHA